MPRPHIQPATLPRLVDVALIVAALGILLLAATKAAIFIDTNHDTWWYHLPWAARLAGLISADAYVYDEFLEQRFAGFPVLMQWIQGQLWRLTGRPEAANFVALASLILFVAFLRVRFRVPAHLTLLALMAVPLIQSHATIAHVDLPANLALATAILLLPPLYGQTEFGPGRGADAVLFLLACGLAAHSKLQLIPIVVPVFVAGLVALAIRQRRSGVERSPGRLLAGLAIAILVGGAIFYVPIKNALRYGNPLYPLALSIGPIDLPGPQGSYIPHSQRLAELHRSRMRAPPAGDAQPGAPAGTSGAPSAHPGGTSAQWALPIRSDPLAWIGSVLELGMEPVLGRGQWVVLGTQRPPLPGRYGGFFGWYAIFHLALLAVLVGSRLRARAGILGLFLAVSLAAALAPSQTILRYYMFWMIVLVSLNLILARPAGGAGAGAVSSATQRAVGLVGLGAFLLVVYATRAELIQPRVYLLEDLIETRRSPAILDRVAHRGMACLAGEMAPRVFLYAPLFNPGKDYRLKMGPMAGDRSEEVADACGPQWTPVIAERADAGLLPPGYRP